MKNPLREICTVGSVRGETSGATANLNGHETGNGGNSQGEPKAHRNLLYSEIDRDQLLEVIVQEGAPSLRGWFAAAHHVFADTGLADVDAEFEQFTVDAGCTPTGILPAYLADQIANLAAMTGRPGWPRRTFQVQNRRKPARCQAMTVSG